MRTNKAGAIILGEGLGHNESNDYFCNKITENSIATAIAIEHNVYSNVHGSRQNLHL